MATKTWLGNNSTWATAAQWSPSGVPAATDDVIINGGTVTVASQTCATLTIGGSCTIDGTILTVNGTITVNSGVTLTHNATNVLNCNGEINILGAISQINASASLVVGGSSSTNANWGTSNFYKVTISKTGASTGCTFTSALNVTASDSTASVFTFSTGYLIQNGKTITARTLINNSGTARQWDQSGDVYVGGSFTGTVVQAAQTNCTYTNRDGILYVNGTGATITAGFGTGVPSTCPRVYLNQNVAYTLSGNVYDLWVHGTHSAATSIVVFRNLQDSSGIPAATSWVGITVTRAAEYDGATTSLTNCTARFGTINFPGGWIASTNYTGSATHAVTFCRANTLATTSTNSVTYNFTSIEIGTALNLNLPSTGGGSNVTIGYARIISGASTVTTLINTTTNLCNIYLDDWDIAGSVAHGAGVLWIGYNSGISLYTTTFTSNSGNARTVNFGKSDGTTATWIVTKSNQSGAAATGSVSFAPSNFATNQGPGGVKMVGTGSHNFGAMLSSQSIKTRVAGTGITLTGSVAELGIEDGGTTAASSFTINKGTIFAVGSSPGSVSNVTLTLSTSDTYSYSFSQALATVTFSDASQTWAISNISATTLNLNGIGSTYNYNSGTCTTITFSTTLNSAGSTLNLNGGTATTLNLNTNPNNVTNLNGFSVTGTANFNFGTLNVKRNFTCGSFVSTSGSARSLIWDIVNSVPTRIISSGTSGRHDISNITNLTIGCYNNDPVWMGGFQHGGTGSCAGIAWSASAPNMRFNTWHTGTGGYSTWYTNNFDIGDGSNTTGTVNITGNLTGGTSASLGALTITQVLSGGTITYNGSTVLPSYTNNIAGITQNLNTCPALSITLNGAGSTYNLGVAGVSDVVQSGTGTITMTGNTSTYNLYRVRCYNLTLNGSNSTYNCYYCEHNYATNPPTAGSVALSAGTLTIKSGFTLTTWTFTCNTGIRGLTFEDNSYITLLNTGNLAFSYTNLTASCSFDNAGFLLQNTGGWGMTGTVPATQDTAFNITTNRTSTPSTASYVRNWTVQDGTVVNSAVTVTVYKNFTGYASGTMTGLTVTQNVSSGTFTYTGTSLAAYNHSVSGVTLTLNTCPSIAITLSGAGSTYNMGVTGGSDLALPTSGTITLSGSSSVYNLYRVRGYGLTLSGADSTYNCYYYEHNYYAANPPTAGTVTLNAGTLVIKTSSTMTTWAFTSTALTARGLTFENNSYITLLNNGVLNLAYSSLTGSCSFDSSGFLHQSTGSCILSGNPGSVNSAFNITTNKTLAFSPSYVRNWIVQDGTVASGTVYVCKNFTGYAGGTMTGLTLNQALGGGTVNYTGTAISSYTHTVDSVTQTIDNLTALNITLSGSSTAYVLGNTSSGGTVALSTSGTITLSGGGTASYDMQRVRSYNTALSSTGTYACYYYEHNYYNANPPTAGTVTHTGGTLTIKENKTMITCAFTSATGTRGITFEANSWIQTLNTGPLNINYDSMTAVCPDTDCGFVHNSSGAWVLGSTAPANPNSVFNLTWSSRCTVTNTSYVKNLGNWNPFDQYRIGGGLIANTAAVTVNVSGNILFTGNAFSSGVIQGDTKWQYLNLIYWGNDATRTSTYRTGYSEFGEGGAFRAFNSLTLASTFTGTLKLNTYFAVASMSHQSGTLDVNGNQLYAESSYTSTDGTANKSIINTAATYSNPSIYINASAGTPWSFAYSNLLTSDSKIWIKVRGGTVSHGATARQTDNQPSFDLSERVAAYTLAPTTDFRVGSLRINNYTVPTDSVWSINGPEFTVQTGGLTAPAAFTVNIIGAGTGSTASCQMTCDNTTFIWPQVTFSGKANIANSGWKFKNININDGANVTSSGQSVYVTNSIQASNVSSGTLNITGSTWYLYGANPINGTVDGPGFGFGTTDVTGILRFEGLNGTNLGNQTAYFYYGYGGRIYNNISYNTGTGVGSLVIWAGPGTNRSVAMITQFDSGYNTSSTIFGCDFFPGGKVPVKGSGMNFGTSSAGYRYIGGQGGNWGGGGINNIETSSVVSGDYLNITNCPVTGGAGWYAGTHSVDNGGNTGWSFYDPPTFSLGSSAAAVNEGSSVTITLTTNLPNSSTVAYTITGITSADIGGASLTGNFTVNNGTATVVLNVTNDFATEGSETLTLSLNNGAASIAVTVNDTSLLPTYSLSRSVSSVTEGDAFTITLTTTNLPNGTTVPYTITGVSSSDILGVSLTGNFTVSGNSASLAVNTSWDYATEGTETFTLTINPTYGTSSSISVAINNLLRPTYALSATPTSLNEGGNFTVTLNTTDVLDNTALPYTITGVSSADINGAGLTGNFTVVSSTASITFTTTGDYLTEGDETFTLSLDSKGTTVSVLIADYYKTRTYSLGTNATTVVEGGTFAITLDTTNVFNGSTVPYTITGVSSADIAGASLTGNFTINDNTGILNFTTSSDLIQEGYETFTLTLGSPANGSIDVTIRDRDASGVGNFLIFFD